MEREITVASAGLAVLVVAVLAAVVVPGALADARSEPAGPSVLSVREQTIAAGTVTGGTATLSVTSRLAHRGGTAENVTVLLRAIDTDTQLVASEVTYELDSVADEREVAVPQNISVPREGDYRIDTIVFADGRRVAMGSKTVNGVGGLQPAYARTGIQFHRFEGSGTDGLSPVHFSIASVQDGEATLNVSAYLTNAGDEPNEQLNVTFMAQQADSNIIADRTVVPVGTIEPGRTETPSARLTVPDNYNYRLRAIVQKDKVIVGSAQAAATLDPSKPVSVNESKDGEDTLDTGDFQQDTPEERSQGQDSPEDTYTASGGGPGFTPVAAVIALVASALYLRRRQ